MNFFLGQGISVCHCTFKNILNLTKINLAQYQSLVCLSNIFSALQGVCSSYCYYLVFDEAKFWIRQLIKLAFFLDIDECASNPCENGDCLNGANTFTCSCFSGWTGKTCSEGITCFKAILIISDLVEFTKSIDLL